MLSFIDGLSRYNWILMAPEDMENTIFIIEWGTYCYKIMSFGLKNIWATYQRLLLSKGSLFSIISLCVEYNTI